MALPDRASRHLGHGYADCRRAFDFVQGGRTDTGNRARRQVKLRLRARSRDGKAAHRGERDACAGRTCRLEVFADAADSRPSAAAQPLKLQGRNDLVRAEDTTPEHVEACRAMMKRAGGYYNAGPFTPFMFQDLDAPPKSTIQSPGGTGGVNWGGMSMDPVNGIFYVNAQNTTLVGWTQPRPSRPNPQTGVMERVNFAGESAGSSHPHDRGSVQGVAPDGRSRWASVRSSRSRLRSMERRRQTPRA